MLKKLLTLPGITAQPARLVAPPLVSSESGETGRLDAAPAGKPVMPGMEDGSEAWARYIQERDVYINDPTPGGPDTPDEGFGLKTFWLAIRSEDSEKILACLPPEHKQRRANWDKGLGYIYRYAGDDNAQHSVFVTPPVQGWTFIVGWGIPELTPHGRAAFDRFSAPFLQAFADIQYYGSYRVVDYIAWGRAEGGTWQRLFAFADAEILCSEGVQTDVEQMLGLPDIRSTDDFETEGVFEYWLECYDEETPLRLAGQWSIDPDTLPDIPAEPALGWLITFPADEK